MTFWETGAGSGGTGNVQNSKNKHSPSNKKSRSDIATGCALV